MVLPESVAGKLSLTDSVVPCILANASTRAYVGSYARMRGLGGFARGSQVFQRCLPLSVAADDGISGMVGRVTGEEISGSVCGMSQQIRRDGAEKSAGGSD